MALPPSASRDVLSASFCGGTYVAYLPSAYSPEVSYPSQLV